MDIDWLISQAKSAGFDLCGIVPASELAAPAGRDEWLARGYAGHMKYLHDARRADPALALPDAQSAIVCAINYNTAHPYSTEAAALAATGAPRAWISRYAWGDDYHAALVEKLETLISAMKEKFGGHFTARAYVDTGPISERVAARQAGLGWLAKNTCLINEDLGSWLFLGVILTSLEFSSSPAVAAAVDAANVGDQATQPPDLCGNCTLCIDACPTGALVEPYVLDASRCISYLTIELRDAIPTEFRAPMSRHVFGCDICQDVCPWNRRAPASQVPVFAPRDHRLVAPEIQWLLSLSEDDFRRIFKGSAIRRTKWRGLIRNACIAAGNSGDRNPALRARLKQLAASADSMIAEHAQWALAQLGVGGPSDASSTSPLP